MLCHLSREGTGEKDPKKDSEAALERNEKKADNVDVTKASSSQVYDPSRMEDHVELERRLLAAPYPSRDMFLARASRTAGKNCLRKTDARLFATFAEHAG